MLLQSLLCDPREWLRLAGRRRVERRAVGDRRHHVERRRASTAAWQGPERRGGSDRRVGNERRAAFA